MVTLKNNNSAENVTSEYDIREIRLVKTRINATASQVIANSRDAENYVCLGHFDLMQFFSVNYSDRTRDPLKQIRFASSRNAEKESNYNYPLFIIKPLRKGCKEDADNFWRKKMNYVLVARIHCDEPIGKDKEYQQDDAEDVCESSIVSRLIKQCESRCIKKGGHFEKSVIGFTMTFPADYQEPIAGALYESLELGDIVCVF